MSLSPDRLVANENIFLTSFAAAGVPLGVPGVTGQVSIQNLLSHGLLHVTEFSMGQVHVTTDSSKKGDQWLPILPACNEANVFAKEHSRQKS